MTNGASITGDARHRPPAARFVEPAVDIVEILDRLEREDAVAVPALTAEYRAWLLVEARTTRFRDARPVVGRGERLVRQRMGVHDGFGPDSRFHDLTRRYQAAWDEWLASMAPYPFESPLVFNDLMLQVYEPGETGITPHMDRTAYRNLICLFVLEGRGRFGICEDRSGRGARIIAHEPGDVVLTRAPGFMGSDDRPFHFLDRITERRYVFGLRHELRGERPGHVGSPCGETGDHLACIPCRPARKFQPAPPERGPRRVRWNQIKC